MALITPPKPITDFVLTTTKPFHSEKAARDFFDLVDSYGTHYMISRYGNWEPLPHTYKESKREHLILSWFQGEKLTEEELESRYLNVFLSMKGKAPSKITYSVGWSNWTNRDCFNMIFVSISKPFLQKSSENMAQFQNFCEDLIRLFPPVHAEIYDYTASIPCTCTKNAFIPDNLCVRCPALKWRTYFGPPYIELLGRDTLLGAPCFKTEEVGDCVVLQLAETVFDEIPPSARDSVVDYLEESVDPQLRANLKKGFLFRPFDVSEDYSSKNKLVPSFPFEELIAKNLSPQTIETLKNPYGSRR